MVISLSEDSQYLLVDVTERQISIDSDIQNQQDDYIGKKELPTMKSLDVCDEKGAILFISNSYQGSTHLESNRIRFWRAKCNGRLGLFFGRKRLAQCYSSIQKPKNGDIKALQKDINKAIGSVREKIVHVFSG